MNAVTEVKTDFNIVSPESSANALVMDPASMTSMLQIADLMASSKVTIPAHLRGSKGDCMAVVMQAMQWGMNPFSIAQKTHLSQSGALGYEAQLINAVLSATGAIKSEPEFEFLGDWSKVLGKVEERKSEKGGKYYVPTYTKSDEDGLGVICRVTMGSGNKREITIMLSQCYPRFSTQWATDPQQQITYVAVRKLARRYAPGAILGVYTPEELEESQPQREIDITPKSEPKEKPVEYCSAEKFDKNKDAWKAIVTSGRKTAPELIIFLESKSPLTDAQKSEISTWRQTPKEPVSDADPFVKALDQSGDYTPE